MSVLNIVKNCAALRPKNEVHVFLLFTTFQPVRINTIYNISRKIIVGFSNLARAKSYTSRCFRSSTATMVASSSAEFYMETQ